MEVGKQVTKQIKSYQDSHHVPRTPPHPIVDEKLSGLPEIFRLPIAPLVFAFWPGIVKGYGTRNKKRDRSKHNMTINAHVL